MLAADQCREVLGPLFQCDAFLRLVTRAIIDPGNTGLMAADVVQDCFDDMRRRSGFGHARGHRAAQIVMRPMFDLGARVLDALIERRLADAPATERPSLSATEYELITFEPFRAGQN